MIVFDNYRQIIEAKREKEITQQKEIRAKLNEMPVDEAKTETTAEPQAPKSSITPTTITKQLPHNGCSNKIPLPRPEPTRINDPTLYIGETQTYPGADGWKVICPSKDPIIYDGYADRIYIDTRQREDTSAPTVAPTQDYAAKQKCDNTYAYAKGTIAVSGAANESALAIIKSQYIQCLASAGFTY